MHAAIEMGIALNPEGLIKALVLTSEYWLIIIAVAIIFLLSIICVAGIHRLNSRLNTLAHKLSPGTVRNTAAGPSAADSQDVRDSELVAVITAAIAAMGSTAGSTAPYPGFRVRSIRRI